MERIKIDHLILQKVYSDLKLMGYSRYSLNPLIGGRIDTALYRSYTIPIDVFKKIEKIVGYSIPHIKIKQNIANIEKFQCNVQFAELVGILLGDGGLHHGKRKNGGGTYYTAEITLNGIDEKDYVEYVMKLVSEVFGKIPILRKRKNEKAVDIRFGDKNVYRILTKYGMIYGNKVKNQVNVPQWIKEKKEYVIACLRGLIDTDGSIYSSDNDKYGIHRIVVLFSNASTPLLNDFKEMCNSIGISTTRVSLRKVSVISKKEVKKFVEVVNPIKWKQLKSKEADIENKLIYKNGKFK